MRETAQERLTSGTGNTCNVSLMNKSTRFKVYLMSSFEYSMRNILKSKYLISFFQVD